MKTLLSCLLITIMVMSVGILVVNAEGLPESVQSQSRKDAVETKVWEKFDKSGPIKFLQVQHTAAASDAGTASQLDGSFGERLIEINVDSSIEGDTAVWTLENKGPGTVWVVANSDGLKETIEVKKGDPVNLETKVVDGYCYLVVDSDGRDKTTLSIKAKVGETDAKTTRGKSMKILWF